MKISLFTIIIILQISIYAQESYSIVFNVKGKINAPSYKGKKANKVPTVRADIQLKQGKFSILLIDFNQNNVFNEYRGCCKDVLGDGILFTGYQEKIINMSFSKRRYLTKNYPLAFNGETYRLRNLRKNKRGFYIANLLKVSIKYKTIFGTKNKVLIDTLPDIVLHNYYNDKKFKLKDKLEKNKDLFIQVMNQRYFLNNLMGDNKNNKLIRHITTKVNTLIVVVIKNRSVDAYIINKYNPKRKEFLIVKSNEKSKMLQLGYNMKDISTFLFDDKGKVIFTDLDNALTLKKAHRKELIRTTN